MHNVCIRLRTLCTRSLFLSFPLSLSRWFSLSLARSLSLSRALLLALSLSHANAQTHTHKRTRTPARLILFCGYLLALRTFSDAPSFVQARCAYGSHQAMFIATPPMIMPSDLDTYTGIAVPMRKQKRHKHETYACKYRMSVVTSVCTY